MNEQLQSGRRGDTFLNLIDDFDAEIVETAFVRSQFLDIRHGYDFVSKRNDEKQRSFSVESARND